MGALTSLRKELRLMFKRKLLLIATCIILLIPCIYAGLFVWSYWDPYSKTDELPIGVVNQDTGTTMDDKSITIGNDLSGQLQDNDDLNVSVISEDQAEKGLKDHDYYMIVRIPEHFSKNAMSALKDHTKKAKLKIVPNEGFNYTAATISTSAMKQVKERVANNITHSYTKALLKAQKQIGNGVSELADGGQQLNQGVSSAEQGTERLHKNISQLAQGTLQFNQGMNQLSSNIQSAETSASKLTAGTQDLSQGLGELEKGSQHLADRTQLSSEKSIELKDGIQQLLNMTGNVNHQVVQENKNEQTHASQLKSKVDHLTTSVKEADEGFNQIRSKMSKHVQKMKDMIKNNESLSKKEKQQMLSQFENFQSQVNQTAHQADMSENEVASSSKAIKQEVQSLTSGDQSLVKGLGKLKAGQKQLLKNAETFSDRQKQLATGAKDLNDGIHSSEKGADQLVDGSKALSSGLAQLTNGTTDLSQSSSKLLNGAQQLNHGSSKLSNGLDNLDQGSNDLSSGLNKMNEKVNDQDIHVDRSSNAMSDPVKLDEEPIHHVSEYGPAFAPYFLALGLYVGMFLFCSVFPLSTFLYARSSFSWFFGKMGVLFIVGALQAVILDGLMLLMGIHVDSIIHFILFTILTCWSFAAILLFINTALGSIGRFVSMALLILQLTASAGSFPLEMLPTFFQKLNPWIPMSYAILGFKSIISAKNNSVLVNSMYALIAFLIIGMLLSLCFYVFRYKKEHKPADPSIEADTATTS
ncbi:YhgE/Pip domain-containing protein [Tuberibacillus sp. Marseille-P3662]|uniref:YhgE/Pip domain-containing protein n=1 Tax=Tuberibacillus sp. Marseille-P3662 TaxID=1965358 RepID=UPI000A1CA852|nr:YhgE/Pip domain-containing protein [Tuberibacillus sp. Marseille-P3662]